ncbi:MAG: A/G-specific adenine glycosylase [Chloroflexi bacterium]|nr:A/G-specific adenine glycosylase [Chloroflexota bacterium]
MTRRRLATRLFAWHAEAGRTLLIRDASTPWEVLVAEVMSHQTGIGRVGPAWRRFVDTWPSPAALADAGTRDLLAAWSGLGYNRRALALRETARRIVLDHGERVPVSVIELETLPGIGPYTARAVAATAFGTPVAPLDVNVRRVMSRVSGSDPGSRDLQETADALVDRRDPRRWLNAVMDLATSTCTKAAPRCGSCPLSRMCASRGDVSVAGMPRRSLPFPQTTRWLRGRLVASLTGASPGAWIPLPLRMGDHDAEAILAAARSLEREGFLELLDGCARVRP